MLGLSSPSFCFKAFSGNAESHATSFSIFCVFSNRSGRIVFPISGLESAYIPIIKSICAWVSCSISSENGLQLRIRLTSQISCEREEWRLYPSRTKRVLGFKIAQVHLHDCIEIFGWNRHWIKIRFSILVCCPNPFRIGFN